MLGQSAYGFIADDAYKLDYPAVYANDTEDASVMVMRLNAKSQDGAPVTTRLVAFNCDTCILVVAMMFPEQPAVPLTNLAVRRVDESLEAQRAMAGAEATASNTQQETSRQVSRASGIFVTRATQPKACFVLECLDAGPEIITPEGLVTKPIGPSIVFVTNSVGRLLDAEGDELIGTPFLRLVAPESLLRASKFIDDLARTDQIVFSSFYLLQTPRLHEDGNQEETAPGRRVEVEVVGAQSDDGVVFLCRRIRVCASPGVAGMPLDAIAIDEEDDAERDGYLSLNEIISSEPETSDCPSRWSSLV
ncbi:hypothetical protein FBU59_004759 [Linderina macrospora]|uniref:Uncharacterized protein n=1 Tax=Linderina macrospora TaxID=4868 RepID=A0ACC1J4N2_9FUNG|nr:hypothetical protein FBU59_004759 [Linderina macrospora]